MLKIAGSNTIIYNWLKRLLRRLKEKGLPVSPDTYIQLVRVLETSTEPITSDNLPDYLSAIIVKNADQLKILRLEYDAFLSEELDDRATSQQKQQGKPATPRQKWLYIAIGATAAILLVIAIVIYNAPSKINADVTLIYSQMVGDTVTFSAMPGLNNARDTQHVKFVWDFGDGSKDSGSYRAYHVYDKPGDYMASLKIIPVSRKVRVLNPIDSFLVLNCAPSPTIEPETNEVQKGETVEFTVAYDPAYPPAKKNIWYVNDSALAYDTYVFRYTFNSPGQHLIRFVPENSSGTICMLQAFRQVTVRDRNKLFFSFAQSGEINADPLLIVNGFWVWTLSGIMLAALGTLLWIGIALGRRNDISKEKAKQILSRFTGQDKPFEIPFRDQDNLIEDERELLNVARTFKRRNIQPVSSLNIPQTIDSTIRSEGFIQPVYSSTTRPVEYLMLIDQTRARNQQVKLFEYLLKKFSRNDLYIDKFYFKIDPNTCYNEFFPNGIRLSQLHDRYPNHVVIIFGTGYQLLDKHYPVFNEVLVQAFRKWDQWAICTPVNYADWGQKEQALQQRAVLFPADLKGQLLLFRLLESHKTDYEEHLAELRADTARKYNFTNVTQLEKYLGDPFLLQWVCAIAVYPRIQWDVLIAIGEAVRSQHYPDKDINYSILLKVVRIGWMQEGSFPAGTRLELLKQLQPRNEKIARETMLRLMTDASAKMDESSFAFEQVEMQRITDQFLLYAHDPVNYAQYKKAYDQFKTLWEQNKVHDTQLATYLRKDSKTQEWSTLIDNKYLSPAHGAGTPLNVFLGNGLNVQRKAAEAWITALFVLVLLCGTLLMSLTQPHVINESHIDRLLGLTSFSTTTPLKVTFIPGPCFANLIAADTSVQLVVKVPGNSLRKFRKIDSVSFMINNLYLTDSIVQVSVTGERTYVDTSFKLNAEALTISLGGCPVSVLNCNQWVAGNNADIPTGAWYDQSIVQAAGTFYSPIYTAPYTIDNKPALELYTCREDPRNQKVILKESNITFRVVYLQQTGLAHELRFAFVNTGFPSLQAAINDTTRPVFQTRVYFPVDSLISSRQNISAIAPFAGAWSNNQDTLIINGGSGAVRLYGDSMEIIGIDKIRTPGLPLYLLTLSRPAENNFRSYLYLVPVNQSTILIESSIDQPSRPGTFYTYTKRAFPTTTTNSIDTTVVANNITLPSSLNEIWTSYEKMQMARFDLRRRRMYYTFNYEDSKEYSIEQVVMTPENEYRVITSQRVSPDIVGYRVFFIRNIKPGSFELAGCEYSSNTPSQALSSISSTCKDYKTMAPLYTNDPDKIFLPLDRKTYAGSEIQKISKIVNSVTNGQVMIDSVSIQIATNTRTVTSTQEEVNTIRQSTAFSQFENIRWRYYFFEGDAFDRDYLEVYTSPKGQSGAPKRILWVDDNPENNTSIINTLSETYNVEITRTSTTGEAMRWLGAYPYDYVISDMERQGDRKEGLVLLQWADSSYPNIPFIIYTGTDNERTIQRIDNKNLVLVTSKPNEVLGYLGGLPRK